MATNITDEQLNCLLDRISTLEKICLTVRSGIERDEFDLYKDNILKRINDYYIEFFGERLVISMELDDNAD